MVLLLFSIGLTYDFDENLDLPKNHTSLDVLDLNSKNVRIILKESGNRVDNVHVVVRKTARWAQSLPLSLYYYIIFLGLVLVTSEHFS